MQIDVMMNALTVILSGSMTAGIARFYIGRFVNHLDEIGMKINEIKVDLSAITAHLEHLKHIQQQVFEHESKIAVLESKIRYKPK